MKSAIARIRNTEPGDLAPQDADQRFPEGPFVGQIVRMISAAVFREFTRSYRNVTGNHDIHRELYDNLDVQGYSNAGSRMQDHGTIRPVPVQIKLMIRRVDGKLCWRHGLPFSWHRK